MTHEPLEPLDPELRVLLGTERRATAPADGLERVWARVAGTGAPGSDGAHAHESTPHLSSRASWIASHAASLCTATFLAGGLVGAGVHATFQRSPPERVVYVERPERSAAPRIEPAPPSPSGVVQRESPVTPPLASVSATLSPLGRAVFARCRAGRPRV
jgi:hypothetical protein